MSLLSRRHVLAILGASVAAPAVLRAQATQPLKIGGMLPLSGVASIEGRQVIQGFKFAVDEWNGKGGLFGRQLQLVMEDDEANSTKGVAAVRKLIESDGAPFILGTYATAVATAASKVAGEYKAPILSGGSTGAAATDQNKPGDPWFFRSWPDSNRQGDDTARAIVNKFHKKSVAIFHDNTNYGVTLAAQVTKVVDSLGGKIVSSDGYATGEQDFSTALTKLRSLAPARGATRGDGPVADAAGQGGFRGDERRGKPPHGRLSSPARAQGDRRGDPGASRARIDAASG